MADAQIKVAVFSEKLLRELEGGRYDFSGLRTAGEAERLGLDYLGFLADNYRFVDFREAESNPSWKQPYVYAVITSKDGMKVFICRSKDDEKKGKMKGKELYGGYNLGLGDNIIRSDELSEETRSERRDVPYNALTRIIDYGFKMSGEVSSVRVLGFINNTRAIPFDDDFGEKHFGVVYLVETESSTVDAKENSLEGRMANFEEITTMVDLSRGEETDVCLDEWSIKIYESLLKDLIARGAGTEMGERQAREEKRRAAHHRRNRRRR